MGARRSNACFIAGLVVGAVLIAFSLAVNFYLVPNLVQSGIKEELVMKPDGPQRDQDFFILKQVWVYNITNPDDVWKKGHLPHFKEIGPFGYRTRMRHKNVTFLEEGAKVRMLTDRVFYYSRENSCDICEEELQLTVPNLLLFTIYGKIKHLPTFVKKQAAKLFIHLRAKPFVTISAAGLLFDGYDEILIKMLREPFMRPIIPNVPDKIGYFSGINATNAGFFTYDTGLLDISKVGQILTWKNKTSVPDHFWDTAQSRMINGSSGGRFKPFLEETDILWAFLSDICRSLYFKFEKSTTVDGLDAMQYAIPPQAFDWELPENKGFCNKAGTNRYFKEQPDNCLPSGLMDLSRCKTAAPPSAASMPHFLYTPDYVQNQFPSISKATPEDHRSWLLLEKTTGVPIFLSLKFQVNIATFHDPDFMFPPSQPPPLIPPFRVLRKLNQTIFPVLWINQTASMDQGTKDLLYEKIYLTQRISFVVLWVVFGLGLLLFLLSLICWFIIGTKRTSEQKYPKPVKV